MLFAGSFSLLFFFRKKKQETSGRRNQNKLKIAFHRNDFLGSEACTHKDPLQKGSYRDGFTVMSHYTLKQMSTHLSLNSICCIGQIFPNPQIIPKTYVIFKRPSRCTTRCCLRCLSVCMPTHFKHCERAGSGRCVVVVVNWMHLILVPTTSSF